MTADNAQAPAIIAPTAAAALEGDVHQPTARHYTYGTDLAYVLEKINEHDPIEIETEDAPDVDWEIHKALQHLRADILRRQAVQAGPRTVNYCGVEGEYGRACGPDLGLPQCAYHGRPAPLNDRTDLDELEAALGLDEHRADDNPEQPAAQR